MQSQRRNKCERVWRLVVTVCHDQQVKGKKKKLVEGRKNSKLEPTNLCTRSEIQKVVMMKVLLHAGRNIADGKVQKDNKSSQAKPDRRPLYHCMYPCHRRSVADARPPVKLEASIMQVSVLIILLCRFICLDSIKHILLQMLSYYKNLIIRILLYNFYYINSII